MSFRRFYLTPLQSDLSRRETSILLGARQVGKTFLMKALLQHAKTPKIKTIYFNLEIPSDLQIFNQSDSALFKLLTQSGQLVFIDEFHYLKNASHLFKAVYDSGKKVKIVASGSSSIEIHKHLKESLAGRRLVTHIYPLTFAEFQSATKKTSGTLEQHLRFGGLPGIYREKNDTGKIRLLDEILNTYISKDIKSLIKEENIRAFNHLLYLLAQNQGGLVSTPSLAGEVGLSVKSLEKYLSILEHTFTLYPLLPYSNNLGNELKKSKKYYLYDLGVRNALLKDFRPVSKRPDKSAIYEAFVYNQFNPHLKPNMELRFWRTKNKEEVDFIFIRDRQPTPIEVKSRLSKPEIPQGLSIFLKRYPHCENAYVLNENLAAKIKLRHATVEFVPFSKIEKLRNTLME